MILPDFGDKLAEGGGVREVDVGVGLAAVAVAARDNGDLPGATEGDDLADPDAALAVLDAFEGTIPGDDVASEYLRQRVTCSDPAGVEAWIYTWNRPTDGFTRLAGGSWRAAAPPAALL